MIALSVNLNKIALIRNSRDTSRPDIVEHARMAIDAGADGITVHPRPDQRHIRASDCYDLSGQLGVEFNIEGNPFAGPRSCDRGDIEDYPGFMALVEEIRPEQCTLVPDGDNQLTSDHGFDLTRDGDRLSPIIEKLQSLGIRVSLFMDPDPDQIMLASQIGADRVELYTEAYADAHRTRSNLKQVFRQYQAAARMASQLGLGVNAGHDLDLENLPMMATLEGLLEVSIGHALVVDALRIGMEQTIEAYQTALGKTVGSSQRKVLV